MFWPIFSEPKEPKPPGPKDQHSDLNPNPGEREPHPSGPLRPPPFKHTYSGFHPPFLAMLVLVWLWVWTPLDHPPPDRPKFRSFFAPLPPQCSFFLPSLGGLLVEFWWCSKRQGLKYPRLEFSGCRVKPRRCVGHSLEHPPTFLLNSKQTCFLVGVVR